MNTVVDCSTGEQTTETLTAEEQAQRDQDTQEAEALRVVEEGQAANETTMSDRAAAALAANATFLALAAPTNAQTLAQVKTLTKECSALIRLQLRMLDSADGT